MYKITKALFAFACVSLLIPMGTIGAKENTTKGNEVQYNVDQEVEEAFASFDSSRKVLQLPDGGYVQGQMIEYIENTYEPTEITVYDSETDVRAVSVETAKELEKKAGRAGNTEVSVTPRGAGVPTATYILPDGDSYTSSVFTASGWRVSDRKYKPASGTGVYLLWTSLVDSGRAGTASQCSSTIYSNTQYGTWLSAGVPVYVDSTDWTMYYTYNPISGTRYTVANK